MAKKVMLFIGVAIVALLAVWGLNTSQTNEQALVTSQAGDVYERSYSPSIGPDNAPVTIVEFFDPACAACRAFYPFVKEIMHRHPDDVRLVLRYAAFHKGSDTAIGMLEAARLQQRFQTVLEALLNGQDQWASHHSPNIDKAWELAGAAGLDVSKAKTLLQSEEFKQRLMQENADIRALKVNQTPTFFVNQQALETFGPNELYALVRENIERRK